MGTCLLERIIMEKKKILVIATGGTIASRPTPDGLMPALSGEDLLALLPELRKVCDVDCRELLQLDSTNLSPCHWILMARAVAENREKYDGFVITHGTDTMAYSASALYYMLENMDKPVILTGSMMPAGETGSDAEGNLLLAFEAALSGHPGVYIAFGNKIIYGNDGRKLSSDEMAAFGNINRPQAGSFSDGQLIWQGDDFLPKGPFQLHDRLDTRAGVLKIVPGLPPSMLKHFVDDGYRAVIIEGYGTGGIPDQESENNFLPLFTYAKNHGCRLICTTQCTYGGVYMDHYEMGVRALRLGVESGGKLTTEALLAKVMIELGEAER